jgi:uncharacterized protein (TIGR00369 family)
MCYRLSQREISPMLTIPFLDHCRIEWVEVTPQHAVYVVNAVAPLTNSRDAAHGGLLMTLLDVTLGQAVLGATEGATSFATIQMNTNFIKPGHGQLRAEARVLRAGRNLAFVEGEVRDSEGGLVATASGIFKPAYAQ